MMVLEEIFKHNKSKNSERFNLRIHRGLSWLKKSALMTNDLDLQFMTLMIAFNAIYAEETEDMLRDQHSFKVFLNRVYHQDYEKVLYKIIWHGDHENLRSFLESPYVYQGYWDYKNQKISQSTWRKNFENEQIRILQAFHNKDTVETLFLTFNRLFTLRNQMLQGGMGYGSSINRRQLDDGAKILLALLPAFIQILIENAHSLDVDKPFYPVVQMS